jgi:hypothetical protein
MPRACARELAVKAPKVDARAVGPTAFDKSVVSEPLRQYLVGNDTDLAYAITDEPSLAEIRAANDRLSRYELRLRAVRTAAVEFAAEAIADIVPKTDRTLINAFIEELTNKLSGGALHEVIPRTVIDVTAAKAWVKTNLTGRAAVEKGAIAHPFEINPSSLEAQVGAGGPRASEAAIASLVSRLHAEELRLRQPPKSFTPEFRFPPMSLPRPASTPSYHFRFRR